MVSFKLRIIREQNRLYSFALQLFDCLQANGSRVFLFHDIVDEMLFVKTKFVISRASFECFLKYQLSKGFHANTFDELTRIIQGNKKKQDNSFMVTFDDANESVFIKAYPFLKLHNIPFIVFITETLIGNPGYLNKDQVMALANDPLCTIGSHGCHHGIFRNLTLKEMDRELTDSRSFLEELTQKPVTCFAFPYGRIVECSVANVKQLKNSGYSFSFSAIAGSLNLSWLSSNYFLPRINVDEKSVKKIRKQQIHSF